MMTDTVQPVVQPYIDVTELALEETRIEKANIFLNEFDEKAQNIILGEEMLPEVKGISMENYKTMILLLYKRDRGFTLEVLLLVTLGVKGCCSIVQ